MSEIKTKYFQTCDFCHKEVETDKSGLLKIWLPGYIVSADGGKTEQRINAYICNDCVERLCHKLGDFLEVEEIEYGGNAIRWRERHAHLIWDGCDGETKFLCSACRAGIRDEEANFCPHCGAAIEREDA